MDANSPMRALRVRHRSEGLDRSAAQVVEQPPSARPAYALVEPLLDSKLVGGLRAGEAAASAGIVEGCSRPTLGVARSFVSTESSAEETVQEMWLAVFRGLDRFEGRSSLRTWVCSASFPTLRERRAAQGPRG